MARSFPAPRLPLALACAAALSGPAAAQQIERVPNPVAVFSGLDKITARTVAFEVSIDETVQFGSLQVTPKVCFTNPPTETPETVAFVEVDEVTLTNEVRRIFSGWMYAASPGLNAVEHPVYDVWITDCKGAGDQDAAPVGPRAGDEVSPDGEVIEEPPGGAPQGEVPMPVPNPFR